MVSVGVGGTRVFVGVGVDETVGVLVFVGVSVGGCHVGHGTRVFVAEGVGDMVLVGEGGRSTNALTLRDGRTMVKMRSSLKGLTASLRASSRPCTTSTCQW
jgi:hypothetical protein